MLKYFDLYGYVSAYFFELQEEFNHACLIHKANL